jgi:hypothetical protein
MAIQPVDLQLAYLATPQSAAVANSVQQAPATAQQAAQAAFAAQLEQREETVIETPKAEGAKIRPDGERGGNPGTYSPRQRRRSYQAQTDDETGGVTVDVGDENHFIDTTA